MRFTSLHMRNFRATRELEIGFEPDVTVIVGRNGAGKTSILDALCIMMQLSRSHFDGPKRGHVISPRADMDIRIDAADCALSLEFAIDDQSSDLVNCDTIAVVAYRDQRTPVFRFSQKLEKWSAATALQPRFVYFRQERGFESGNSRQSKSETTELLDPEAVQDRSLEKDLKAITGFEAWWDRRDAQEARRVRDGDHDYRDPKLEAIRGLVAKIDSFSSIMFDSTISPPGLYFIKMDGTPVHVRSLSSGERSFIVLLADLARRVQVFEPGKPLNEIATIVLIDEIELNLHPAWQSQIVPMLAEVFAACQFIVTTHSPQVLSGVENRQVRILESDDSGTMKVSTPLSTRGRTSNYLLEGILGASERYPPINALIGDFNAAIDRDDDAAAAEKLAMLEEEIGDDAATLLVLRKRLKRLRSAS